MAFGARLPELVLPLTDGTARTRALRVGLTGESLLCCRSAGGDEVRLPVLQKACRLLLSLAAEANRVGANQMLTATPPPRNPKWREAAREIAFRDSYRRPGGNTCPGDTGREKHQDVNSVFLQISQQAPSQPRWDSYHALLHQMKSALGQRQETRKEDEKGWMASKLDSIGAEKTDMTPEAEVHASILKPCLPFYDNQTLKLVHPLLSGRFLSCQPSPDTAWVCLGLTGSLPLQWQEMDLLGGGA